MNEAEFAKEWDKRNATERLSWLCIKTKSVLFFSDWSELETRERALLLNWSQLRNKSETQIKAEGRAACLSYYTGKVKSPVQNPYRKTPYGRVWQRGYSNAMTNEVEPEFRRQGKIIDL